MSDEQAAHGKIVWVDLTVPDAESVRDFYAAVVGWRPQAESCGEYDDYNMTNATGEAVCGICHARGSNANIPPQWLVYVQVADLAASLKEATQRGGTVVDGPRRMGNNSFAVLQDPAGAVLALIEPIASG